MLLVVDVGNTNITFGVFDGESLRGTFRMTTKLQRTSDEYGVSIRDLLAHNKMDPAEIRDVIIASVVPNVMHSLLSSFIKYFDMYLSTPKFMHCSTKMVVTEILNSNPSSKVIPFFT